MKPFNLWRPINPRMSMHRTDVRNTGKALRFLGFPTGAEDKETDESEEAVIDSLRRFQRQFGLKPDGVMYPNGPTHRRMKEVLSQSPSGAADRTSIVEGEHDDPKRSAGRARTTLLGSRRGQEPGEARLLNIPSNAGQEQQDNDGAAPADREETAAQVAFAAPAARFAIWLMERYGAPTIAAAMAMYNRWTKKRQNAALEEFESQDDLEDDYCTRRFLREFDRCETRPEEHRPGCRGRAEQRRNLCKTNGGVPNLDEPPEWSWRDEL